MSQSYGPRSSSEPPPEEPPPSRGLEDPRAIHPAPEDNLPDPSGSPGEVPTAESDATPARDDLAPADEAGGIVDPRHDVIGQLARSCVQPSRSHARRGNAVFDAPRRHSREAKVRPRSGQDGIPTQSVGTRLSHDNNF